MNAQTSLTELLRLSTQVVEAVVSGPAGAVEAATVGEERAQELATAGTELLAAAADVRPGVEVERVAVELSSGSVVVVRSGERSLAATTVPEPTLGLVTYDLRTALTRIEAAPASRSRSRKRADA